MPSILKASNFRKKGLADREHFSVPLSSLLAAELSCPHGSPPSLPRAMVHSSTVEERRLHIKCTSSEIPPRFTPSETSLRNPEAPPVESDPRRNQDQARPPESTETEGRLTCRRLAICSSISEQIQRAESRAGRKKRTHPEPTASRSPPRVEVAAPAAACLVLGARSRSPMGPRSLWLCRE